uniref:Uncharacterized protein n=1 Tax=Arundo donax TaxID=35708 RepID=A0A0A9HBY5_ARUDO
MQAAAVRQNRYPTSLHASITARRGGEPAAWAQRRPRAGPCAAWTARTSPPCSAPPSPRRPGASTRRRAADWRASPAPS